MNSAERKISQLERVLKREIETNRNGRNNFKIGHIEFELSQLYKLSGSMSKSKEMLESALTILQDPASKRGKKTERLIRVIYFYINNPTAPPLVQLPPLLRYLSPITLLVGYAAAYAAYFKGFISYTNFFIVAFSVFITSILVSSISSISYSRRIRNEFPSSFYSAPGNEGSNRSASGEDPDDVVNDARAEISLAEMFYSVKNFKEAKLHLEKARMFLNDPMTDRSQKKEQALLSLNKLEAAMQGKEVSREKRRFTNF